MSRMWIGNKEDLDLCRNKMAMAVQVVWKHWGSE